jgi:signal transduction histidine kinase
MNRDRIQTRIGLLILALAGFALLGTAVDRAVFRHLGPVQVLLDPSIAMLVVSLVYFGVCQALRNDAGRLFQAFGVFGLSGPLILFNGSESYFGLAFVVLGVLMFHRYGFLVQYFRWKAGLLLLWCVAWILAANSLYRQESPAVSVNILAFLTVNLLILFILFEEEIRDLLAANRHKDAELAAKTKEIARLEPLSVLGERVAHVAHSFKNNLNQVSTALFLLEQVQDPERAAAKLREFSKTLDERIENILMVSRAGVDLEPELFDVARLLEGMKQVYLQERTFLERAKTVMSVEGPVLVHAVRWDFLLMVENILKNALEAITEHRGTGTIRIDLARGHLTIANDGGAIPLCRTCGDDCLNCTRYGKPGQTTKEGGTGHGLAQVMSTCRNNGWSLKIRTHEDWTIFEIQLPRQDLEA